MMENNFLLAASEPQDPGTHPGEGRNASYRNCMQTLFPDDTAGTCPKLAGEGERNSRGENTYKTTSCSYLAAYRLPPYNPSPLRTIQAAHGDKGRALLLTVSLRVPPPRASRSRNPRRGTPHARHREVLKRAFSLCFSLCW